MTNGGRARLIPELAALRPRSGWRDREEQGPEAMLEMYDQLLAFHRR